MKYFPKVLLSFSILLPILLLGCDVQTQPGTSSSESKPAHPGLNFHRPENLSAAVERLELIHEAVIGAGALPQARKIEYVEVVHGEGAAAHSHFYCADEYDSTGGYDEHDDHDHEQESIERHTMEVDCRKEFADIVKWLPDLAAKSDLGEADWESVSSASKQMKNVLPSIASDVNDPQFRDSWKKQSGQVDAMLVQLKKIAAPKGGVAK